MGVRDGLPTPARVGRDAFDGLGFLEFLCFGLSLFGIVVVECLDLVVGKLVGRGLLELTPVGLAYLGTLSFVLLKDIDQLGKFQTLEADWVLACLKSVADDVPLLELHGWEGVAQMVDGVDEVAVRCDGL